MIIVKSKAGINTGLRPDKFLVKFNTVEYYSTQIKKNLRAVRPEPMLYASFWSHVTENTCGLSVPNGRIKPVQGKEMWLLILQ